MLPLIFAVFDKITLVWNNKSIQKGHLYTLGSNLTKTNFDKLFFFNSSIFCGVIVLKNERKKKKRKTLSEVFFNR